MRSHRAILRKIAELNLDPKVPYISDKNGNIFPKLKEEKQTIKPEDKIDYILGGRLDVTLTEDNIIESAKEEFLDTFEDVKESVESKEEVSEKKEDTEPVEDNAVKKKFPFQKKKVVPTE